MVIETIENTIVLLELILAYRPLPFQRLASLQESVTRQNKPIDPLHFITPDHARGYAENFLTFLSIHTKLPSVSQPRSISKLRGRLPAWLADELHPEQIVRSLSTSFLIYILETIEVISFAALIFSGELSNQLSSAIGLILIGDALLVLCISMLSSYSGSIAGCQDAPVAILALTAAAVVAALPAGASQAERFSTVVIMIVLTSMGTGLFFVLLGVFKLGGLVRYLPYSVIGGFLAGTGWLLSMGGVGVMAGASVSLALFQPALLIRWLPGVFLALVMLVTAYRSGNPPVLLVVFALGIGLFYATAWLTKTSFADLSAQGWLLGSFPSGGMLRFPLQAGLLSNVNWPVLSTQLVNLSPVLIVSVIALLLNANGLELVIKKDIDLNRELVTAGIGNLAAGLGGGVVGYHAISRSSLNHTASGGKRLVGLLTGLLIGMTAFLGAGYLRYAPKMVLGALLVFLGLSFLHDWVYQAWFKFHKSEFVIILVILLVIAIRGFLEGIALGLVMAIILFVVNYSQVSVVKQTLYGTVYRSRVTRSRSQWEALTALGEELCILKLQGFIFFGTAISLFEQVRDLGQRADPRPMRFAVLDFAQVTGLDSTALLSFNKLLQLAQEKRFNLVLCGLSDRTSEQFAKGGFQAQPGVLQLISDLDHAIEWCENQILASVPLDTEAESSLRAELAEILPGEEPRLDRLMGYLERRELAPGEYLIHQGDAPEMMYFIESGQVTARLENPGQQPVRLETMGGGRTVGELGFFLGIKRTAAVVADQPSVVYCISKEVLGEMEKVHPEEANTFHRIIIQLLGERTVHLIRSVEALQR